jgi:addiction module RelB/DinJ family antitoxin
LRITAKINVNTAPETKRAAEALFEAIGMNMTTAINVFLKKAIQYKGSPFDVSVARRESVSKGANGGICPRFCDLKSFYFFETFVLRFRKPCIGLLFFGACAKI